MEGVCAGTCTVGSNPTLSASPRTNGVVAPRYHSEPQRISILNLTEEDDPAEEYDSLLTLEFNECAGGTEFVLTHEKLATDESRERHTEGWTMIVDLLAGVLKP